jgi:hypothetical protein
MKLLSFLPGNLCRPRTITTEAKAEALQSEAVLTVTDSGKFQAKKDPLPCQI